MLETETKQCRRCCKRLAFDCFYKRSDTGKPDFVCKPCRLEYSRSRNVKVKLMVPKGIKKTPRQYRIVNAGRAAIMRWRRAEFGEFREPERLLTTLAQPLHRYA